MEELFNEIGSAIKKARKSKKLTMLDLSQQVGLSQSAISMIENGLRHPSIQTLKKFSQALDMDFTTLIDAIPAQQPSPTAKESNTFAIKTQDFQVDVELKNFTCAYSDLEIQSTIYDELNQFLTTLFNNEAIMNQLDETMKNAMEKKLREKQEELNKLYNRIKQ